MWLAWVYWQIGLASLEKQSFWSWGGEVELLTVWAFDFLTFMSGHSGFSQATWHSCWNRTRWASCCNYLFSPVSSQICSDENIACKMSQGQTNPLPKACRQVFPTALCKFFFYADCGSGWLDEWMWLFGLSTSAVHSHKGVCTQSFTWVSEAGGMLHCYMIPVSWYYCTLSAWVSACILRSQARTDLRAYWPASEEQEEQSVRTTWSNKSNIRTCQFKQWMPWANPPQSCRKSSCMPRTEHAQNQKQQKHLQVFHLLARPIDSDLRILPHMILPSLCSSLPGWCHCHREHLQYQGTSCARMVRHGAAEACGALHFILPEVLSI